MELLAGSLPLAPECQAAGGQALAVPTDVTNKAGGRAGRRAGERFGRIDVWVNCANHLDRAL